MGNLNKNKKTLKEVFKWVMNHKMINDTYNDLRAYDKSKNESFKRDIESIEYIACELYEDADKAVDTALDIFVDKIAEYTKALLVNEELEHYEYCQKLKDLIYIQKDLCYNYLKHNWNVDKYTIFHLNEVINKFEETQRKAREHNYDYKKAIKDLNQSI